MDDNEYRSRLYDMLNRDSAIESDPASHSGSSTSAHPGGRGTNNSRVVLEEKDRHVATHATSEAELAERQAKKRKKDKKSKKESWKDEFGSPRGVETLFRTSYATHMDLSALADNKANIMISINGIIVSVLLASISPKLDANPWLMVPTIMVLFGCLVSLSCAVLAALPRVSSKVVNMDDVRRSRGNLLFFGNFTRFSEDEYVQGMTELLRDTPRLYQSMMRDIYGLGNVLARKFRLLRIAYITFMVGLIIGVVLFVGVYVGIATVPPTVQTGTPTPTVPPVLAPQF